ncbi:hypothetical protein [Vibrio marisflavi]|uniref:Uncharacterized protein n=1 Tax=Vibrio marisflavi CECT 7928 TaxID=634439 RepID=A0ABM9A1T0_9VIBR|nr:hypothetical protein [Vibrio marisflavi]CAH0537633.1 hypothetical protein VMF7928_01209 [Vibrio marisflavi CECT 7928]
MERFCPNCHTQLVERSTAYICPRHEIGECTYEPAYPEKVQHQCQKKRATAQHQREAEAVF